MDQLPPHIRPEDEVYFRRVPLAPMGFRARWVLGFKILVLAQLVYLPITLFFRLADWLGDRLPSHAALAGIAACFILGPLWATELFRGWVSSTSAQRQIDRMLAHPEVAPKP